MKKLKKPSFARLSPLAKGRIVGLREAGTERDGIVKQVQKKDGKSPSLKAVDNVLQRFKEVPLAFQAHSRIPQPSCRLSQPGHIQVTSRSHPGHIQVTSRSCK